jgi:hypothetical protein
MVGGHATPAVGMRRLAVFLYVRNLGAYRRRQFACLVLQRAEKPLASRDIAECIVTARGYGRDSIHALTRRVRANLSYLLRNKRVTKTGDRLTARWALPTETKAAAN